jgi:hypothetical protein
MKIKHTFKSSRDNNGYGYYGYINEKNQLVLGESWPHEGGDTYTGSYEEAVSILKTFKDKAPRLYNDIVKYYTKNQAETNVQALAFLGFGDKFIRVDTEDPDKYMRIDFDVAKCFVAGEKLSGFVAVLGLQDYRVYLFDSTTKVKVLNESRI